MWTMSAIADSDTSTCLASGGVGQMTKRVWQSSGLDVPLTCSI